MAFGSLRKYSLVYYKFVAFHRASDFFLCRRRRDQTLKLCSQLGKLQRCQSGIHIYIGKIRFGRLDIDLLFLHAKYLLYFVMSLLKGLAFPSAKLN